MTRLICITAIILLCVSPALAQEREIVGECNLDSCQVAFVNNVTTLRKGASGELKSYQIRTELQLLGNESEPTGDLEIEWAYCSRKTPLVLGFYDQDGRRSFAAHKVPMPADFFLGGSTAANVWQAVCGIKVDDIAATVDRKETSALIDKIKAPEDVF